MRTMLRPCLALGFAGAALVVAPGHADAQEPAEVDRTHEVRPGDTLWDIARTYLGDPFLWPEIFRINVDAIRDPARIFPSTTLRIPGQVAMGDRAPADTVTARREPGRTIFWRQGVRVEGAQEMVIRAAGTADVPIIAPGDFYAASYVAEPHEVEPVAILAERLSETVVPIVIEPLVALLDVVYLAIEPGEAVRVGDRFHLVRRGAEIRGHGRIYQPTGVARVLAVDGATATAEIIQVYDPIAPGDLALRIPEFPVEAGVSPRAVSPTLQGRLIGFEDDDFALQMTQSRAYLDLGRADGVREGDEIQVFIPALERRWGTRPEVEVARMRIVRATGQYATGRVIRLEHPALEPGMAVRDVARMP